MFRLIENSNVYCFCLCFIKSKRLSCHVGKCHDEMSDVNVIQARYDNSRRTSLIVTLNLLPFKQFLLSKSGKRFPWSLLK